MGVNSRLFINVGFVNSAFEAIDNTPYERWIDDDIFDSGNEHMMVHRLVQVNSDGDNQLIDLQVFTSGDIDQVRNPYRRENATNGLYYYQKLIIPSIEHTTDANERLYYDEFGTIHFDNIDSQIYEEYDIVEDFDEVYEIIHTYHPDNCFYFDDYSFTIYDLIKCYILTEKERINNYLRNNCSGNCNRGVNDLDTKADILLAAIMVIKDLMEKGEYAEAQRILDGLNTCGNLCKNYVNRLKGCGCGRTKR